MRPFTLFLLMLRAALLSSGGMGNVSSLHDALIPRHYATDSQFVQALTVGQLAPGPNGLWVVSLGYLMLGPWGSVAALLGILFPPFLIIGVDHLYGHVKHHPAVEGFVRGLNLAVAGVFAPIMVKLLIGSGVDNLKIAIVAGAFALGWIRRLPMGVILAVAAIVGALLSKSQGVHHVP